MTWLRFETPRSVCSCSHGLTAHDISTKAQACSVCACTAFDLTELHFTERRVVVEPVTS